MWALALFLLLAVTNVAAAQDLSVWCKDKNSQFVSTGVFTDAANVKGLRVCCGTLQAATSATRYDDLAVSLAGAPPQTVQCYNPDDATCCYDITKDAQLAVPSMLHNLAGPQDLPPQAAFVRDEGKSWVFWTSEADDGSSTQRLWRENMQACHAHGGLMLDVPLIATGYNKQPEGDPTTLAAGVKVVASVLNAIPQYIDERQPMHASQRLGFPSPSCDSLSMGAVLKEAFNLTVFDENYLPISIKRPYWEGSGVYADGTSDAQQQCAGIDECCLVIYVDDAGQFQSDYRSCTSNNLRSAMCFKQRDFGRVSLDEGFIATLDSWGTWQSKCAAAQGRLLIADTFYKRQFALSAMLWNDPQLTANHLVGDAAASPNYAQGAVGLVQKTGAQTYYSDWAWSNGVPLPAAFNPGTSPWYQNVNYKTEPNDYAPNKVGTTVNNFTDDESGAQNNAALGVAGGWSEFLDYCAKKPPVGNASINVFAAAASGVSLEAAAAAANTEVAALTHAEAAGLLDVDSTNVMKGLCEYGPQPSGTQTYSYFDMANCLPQRTVIAGVAYNPSDDQGGAPVFEARCQVGVSNDQKLQDWTTTIGARLPISSSQVSGCPDGVTQFAVSMGAMGLSQLSSRCGSSDPLLGGALPTTDVVKASGTSDSSSSNTTKIVVAAAVSAVVVLAVILLLVGFLAIRRRKAAARAAGAEGQEKRAFEAEGGVVASGHSFPDLADLPPPPTRWTNPPSGKSMNCDNSTQRSGTDRTAASDSSGEGTLKQRTQTSEISMPSPPHTLVFIREVHSKPSSDTSGITMDAPLSTGALSLEDEADQGAYGGIQNIRDAASADQGIAFITAQIRAILKYRDGVIFERYKLLGMSEIRVGGQGVVTFARGRFKQTQYAIKFFVSRAAFQTEMEMYAIPRLQSVLPPVDDICVNDDGKWRDPFNRPLAPFVVMERGEALDEWSARAAPSMPMALAVLMHLMKSVIEMHAQGLVHRDLKPSNSLLLPSNNRWTLCDFGSAAPIGQPARLSISICYAAPETAAAFKAGEGTVIASTAVDVWSFGVMAWELFSGSRVFEAGTTTEEAIETLIGNGAALPWEDLEAPACRAAMRKLGKMKRGVLHMLQRDPAARPKLDEIRREWDAVLFATTKSEYTTHM